MFGIPLKELLPILFTTVIAIFVGYKEWKERYKRREVGMAANPERCADHEERLRHIESDIGEIKGDVKAIKVKVSLPIE